MGTSSSYGGPGNGTPLIPSWLDGGEGSFPPPDGGQDDGNLPPSPQVPPGGDELPNVVPPGRFQIPRNNFTRFAKSGGDDRAGLGRALSGYVSTSSGGSHQAARRMGSSRVATSKLANFLSNARSQGVQEALKFLNLENLAGNSIEHIFLGLADYVCPEGGTVDDGIARDAFVETIANLAELGIVDLESLTAEQMQTVLEMYATNAIEARLCNDIGNKITIAPNGVRAFEKVQDLLRDFISRAVSDALTGETLKFDALTPDKTLQVVDHVYERAFDMLEKIGEMEAHAK